jgi:PAS domain S-box-containing protein
MSLDPSRLADPVDRMESPARTTAEWQFLVALNDKLRPLKDPVQIQEAAVRALGEYLGVSRVSYADIDGDEFIVGRSYHHGVAPFVGRRPIAAFGKALVEAYKRGETVAVNDVRRDPRFTEAEREGLLASEIGAFVGVMLYKEGKWLAAFGVHNATPRNWTPEQIALIEMTGERAWADAERAGVRDALRAKDERLAFLLRLSDELRPLSNPSDMQQAAARLLGEHLRANRVNYADIDGDQFVVRQSYANGVAPFAGRGPVALFGARRLAAFRRFETVSVPDVRSDAVLTEDERATLLAAEVAAFTAVMVLKNGQWVGALSAHSALPRTWTQDEIELIRDVADRTWEAVERTRAEAALREREQRLRLALEASTAGSWTWDSSTNQIDWDDGFRVRYGFTPDEPPTFDAWLARVHEEDRAQVLSLLNEVLHTSTKDAWDNTFRIVWPDGTVLWIQSRGRAERDINGHVTRLTGLELDITQRKRTDEALRARREEERDRELRLVLETATQGIVSVAAQGTILTANHAFEAMFGWAPGELVGQSIDRLLPASLRGVHARHRVEYFIAPHSRLMGGGLDLAGERKDGSIFPVEISLSHVATSGGEHTFAFVTDITERRRAALALQERTVELEHRTAQLSQMASDLTLAEQRAREQIASTLHDGLQQMLVMAALNLERQLKLETERGSAPSEPLAEAKTQLDEAIEAARSLSFELFPPVLQHSGLPDALAWLGRWTQAKYGLEVKVTADPAANPARKDVRTLLFESVRELLFNAVKHAQIDRVAVDLGVSSDNQLCITVSDQGIGFDPAGLGDRSRAGQVGWGLFSIRERMALLGGGLHIESAPGQGSRFRLMAPGASTRSA